MYRTIFAAGSSIISLCLSSGEERRYKPQSEWDIVENTHDAIVSYDTWHKAQIIRSTRSTPYKQDMKNTVFSRMCKCVYCGATLNKHTYHNSPMLECPTKHIKTGICPGCVITFDNGP